MPEGMTLGIDVETGQPITISDRDRCGGFYALGVPRVGKSTLFISMALQDIVRGHGLLFIDPHADAIAEILQRIPKRRLNPTTSLVCHVSISATKGRLYPAYLNYRQR